MSIFRFSGSVAPRGFVIKKNGAPVTFFAGPLTGISIGYSISDSMVDIDCDISSSPLIDLWILHIFAYYMVRGVLDAIAFSLGIGLTLILDTFTSPDGATTPLHSRSGPLSKLCTVSYREILELSDKERAILKHLHELTDTFVNVLDTEDNCAKAVEGFAQLLMPGVKDVPRWRKMQENLNITESYIKFITDLSRGPRHGTTDTQSFPHMAEAQIRSWTIANRFMEFRKRDNINLTLPEFPLL